MFKYPQKVTEHPIVLLSYNASMAFLWYNCARLQFACYSSNCLIANGQLSSCLILSDHEHSIRSVGKALGLS